MAAETDKPTSIRFTQLFIDGKFVDSISGKRFPTIDPATEDVIAEFAEAQAEDVDLAVQAAARALPAFRELGHAARRSLLTRLAALVSASAARLSALEALDNGKPQKMAQLVDMNTAVGLLEYYAGWCDKLSASSIHDPSSGVLTYTKYEPVGVVAAIVPFNFPLLGAICKLGPAIATGNTIVIKSAERTPVTACYLAHLVQEAGFPAGVVNIITGRGDVAGAALVSHPLVNKVTFTGSNAVGRHIQKVAADTMKRVTLELGGKNACLVLPDADIDTAVKIASGGNYFNSGQICVGITRVFVPEDKYDEFVSKAAERASARTLGDQWSGADQGPLIDETQMNRVLNYINIGIKEGARLVCGGHRHGTKGYYVQPTIFADVTDDMTIAKEEIFGPVMSVLKYKDVDEAVRRANATPFGLAATIITPDVSRAITIANKLETGTVWINTHGVFNAPAPYGGFKQSGVGREYGWEGLLPYMELKTVMVALPA